LELRFIEYMPLDGDRRWQQDHVLPGHEILDRLTEAIGPLEAVLEPDSNAPATRYRFVDGTGTIGIVRSVSEPFCDRCSRLRLTAEGKVRNCLFAEDEWDARALIRTGATDLELAQLVREAVLGKRKAHGTDNGEFAHSFRAMHQIGG
jgi:cyclic pyranopterin phosphate synthase